MVLDQVGYGALCSVVPPTVAGPYPLALEYVSRTTPVGHATISTGQWPSVHGSRHELYDDVVAISRGDRACRRTAGGSRRTRRACGGAPGTAARGAPTARRGCCRTRAARSPRRGAPS